MSTTDDQSADFMDTCQEETLAAWQPQAVGSALVMLPYIWSPYHVDLDSGSISATVEGWTMVAAHVRTVSVPGMMSDDLLTVGGILHRIVAVRPQSGGMTIAVLQKTLAGSRP